MRALHQLTSEMAQARAEARQYAAVSERSLSTAWRLGQLGQLGLALLEAGDDAAEPAQLDDDDEGGLYGDEAHLPDDPRLGPGRWEQLMRATEYSPPLSDEPLLPSVREMAGMGDARRSVSFEEKPRYDENGDGAVDI